MTTNKPRAHTSNCSEWDMWPVSEWHHYSLFIWEACASHPTHMRSWRLFTYSSRMYNSVSSLSLSVFSSRSLHFLLNRVTYNSAGLTYPTVSVLWAALTNGSSWPLAGYIANSIAMWGYLDAFVWLLDVPDVSQMPCWDWGAELEMFGISNRAVFMVCFRLTPILCTSVFILKHLGTWVISVLSLLFLIWTSTPSFMIVCLCVCFLFVLLRVLSVY